MLEYFYARMAIGLTILRKYFVSALACDELPESPELRGDFFACGGYYSSAVFLP